MSTRGKELRYRVGERSYECRLTRGAVVEWECMLMALPIGLRSPALDGDESDKKRGVCRHCCLVGKGGRSRGLLRSKGKTDATRSPNHRSERLNCSPGVAWAWSPLLSHSPPLELTWWPSGPRSVQTCSRLADDPRGQRAAPVRPIFALEHTPWALGEGRALRHRHGLNNFAQSRMAVLLSQLNSQQLSGTKRGTVHEMR